MNAWIAYALGLITIPISIAVFWFLRWATLREWGWDGCQFCDHIRHCEIGERTNIASWFQSMMHRFIWARTPSHRLAAGNHWRELKARNITRKWNAKYMR